MQLIRPDKATYEAFLAGAERYFHQQTYASMEASREEGSRCEIVAMADEAGTLLCGAKIFYLRLKKFFLSAELYFGPIFDSEKPERLEQFLSLLLKELRKNPRVIRFRIAPLIERFRYRELEDKEENPLAARYDQIFCKLGMKRLNLDYNEARGIQARTFYLKDLKGLDEEALFSSLAVSCRNDMRKAERYGIKVRFLGPDELDLFNQMMKATLERTEMPEFVALYANPGLLKHFGGQMLFPLAYMDVPFSIKKLEDEDRELADEAERLAEGAPTRRTRSRMNEIREAREACARRLEEVRSLGEKEGSLIPMASAQFTFSPSDCCYLQSVGFGTYYSFAPVYAMHRVMLKEALKRGCRYYNFFAVSPLDRESSDQSVLQFKEKFNGFFCQWLGTYEARTTRFPGL